LAVAFAIWAQLIVPYNRQLVARNSLRDHIDQMTAEPAWPSWLSDLDPDRFARVVMIRAHTDNITDDDLAAIGDMAFVRRLYLNRLPIGDLTARQIAGLENLQRLSLWGTRVTDAGLASLSNCRELVALDLHDTCVSDRGLQSLVALPKLQELTLGQTICGPGLQSVARLANLRRLDLSRTSVDFDSLKDLAGSPIRELKFTERVPARICQALPLLPKLRTFDAQIVRADDASAKLLSRCKQLESIDIAGDRVTDVATAELIKLPQLRRLHLHGDLTDKTLAAVESAHQLESVKLSGRFSAAAIEQLATRREQLAIEIRTVLPAAYKNPQADNLIVEPLLSRRPVGLEGAQMEIHWPATLADYLALPAGSRENINALRLLNPPSVESGFRSQFQRQWSLANADQLKNIALLWIPRVRPGELAMLGKMPALETVILNDDRLTDDELDQIELPEKCRLVVTPTSVSRDALTRLQARFPSVWIRENNHGSIFGNRRWQSSWTGQGSIADILRFPGLEVVQFEDIRWTIDLTPLASMQKLTEISFRGSINNAPIFALQADLPSVKSLSFFMHGFNDNQLTQLRRMPALESLLLRNTSVTDAGLATLAGLPNLQELNFETEHITGRGFRHLANCPAIERLEFRRMKLEERHFAHLANLPQLRELTLHNTSVGDEACKYIAMIPNLQTLNLGRAEITDAGLRSLSECPRLKKLLFGSHHVTRDGLSAVAENRALREIYLSYSQKLSQADLQQVLSGVRNLTIDY
jgi:Leucine-rich repeat (LRR) protein